jgi:hypothetical protein
MGGDNNTVWTAMADDWAMRFEREAKTGEYGMATNHIGKGDLDPAKDYLLRKIGYEGLTLETLKGRLSLVDGVDGCDISELYTVSKQKISKADMLALVRKTFSYIEKLQVLYRKTQKEIEEKQNPPKRVAVKWYE